MLIIGKVQWWDSYYAKGIIEDFQKKEYYFDKSAVLSSPAKLKQKQIVVFQLNTAIKHIPCAYKVKILTKKNVKQTKLKYTKTPKTLQIAS